jgi:hypothetical protein
MTELLELLEPLEVPTAEIQTVIDWIKSEQVRSIQQDRTLNPYKVQKLDWLSDTVDNLKVLHERAEADKREVESKNNWRKRQNEEIAKRSACVCEHGCACQRGN